MSCWETHNGKCLRSQTKTLVLDFSLRPNLNLNSSLKPVHIHVWSQTKVSDLVSAKDKVTHCNYNRNDSAAQQLLQSLFFSVCLHLNNLSGITDINITINIRLAQWTTPKKTSALSVAGGLNDVIPSCYTNAALKIFTLLHLHDSKLSPQSMQANMS